MSLPYGVLDRLPPEAFLCPDLFFTDWDARPGQSNETYLEEYDRRFRDGLTLGRDSKRVSIAVNSTWSSAPKSGGQVTSYEGIGHHRSTQAFWAGVLASGVEVVVYRWKNGDKIRGYRIQPGPVEEVK